MTQPSPSERQSYRQSFIRHVHEWLALGYVRLNAAAFVAAEEEDITGELVRAMCEFADSVDAPAWVDSMVAQEDRWISPPKLRGKRRPRIDIEFQRTGNRPRLRFGIEAKRLYRSDSVSKYVGKEGLGCFLIGKYAADDSNAGMLGYVQHKEIEHWAKKLAKKLADKKAYQVSPEGAWQRFTLVSTLSHTFRSQHNRAVDQEPIEIFHTLLRFW